MSRKIILLAFALIALVALVTGYMVFGGANMGSP